MRLLWKIRLVRTCSNKNNMWLDARGLNWVALGLSVAPLSSQHTLEVHPSSISVDPNQSTGTTENYIVSTIYVSILIVTQR